MSNESDGKPLLLLVDGTGLLVRTRRAKYSGRLSAPVEGEPVITGPLFFFIRSLARYIRDSGPDLILVAWDGQESREWRREQFPRYKAARGEIPSPEDDDLLSRLREITDAMGLCSVSHPAFEADDVIAWACTTAEDQDIPLIDIRSDDHDLHQLLVTRYRRQLPLGAQATAMNQEIAQREHGFYPGFLPLVRALAGDSSDGIPGVPGIGPRTAVRLLERACWRLDEIRHPLLDSNAQLRAEVRRFRDISDLSLRSEDLWCHLTDNGRAPFDLASRCAFSRDRAGAGIRPLLERYSMKSLVTALDTGKIW